MQTLDHARKKERTWPAESRKTELRCVSSPPLSAALPRIRPKIYTPFRGSGLKNIALEGGSCGSRIGIAESRATAGLPIPLSRICRRFARFKGAAPSAAPLFWRKAGGRRQTILFPSIQHSAEVNGTNLTGFPLLSPLLGRMLNSALQGKNLGTGQLERIRRTKHAEPRRARRIECV